MKKNKPLVFSKAKKNINQPGTRSFILRSVFLFLVFTTKAQVGIGTDNPDASAILELKSDSKVFILPRINPNNIQTTPAEGSLIYNTEKKCVSVYLNGKWNCLSLASGSATKGVQPTVERYVAIKDQNFLNYLKTILPANAFNKEGKLDTNSNEVKTLKRINVRKREIKNLKDIQYFIGLTHLECSYNELESLDLSKNTMLDTLRCHKNKLKNLNVSQNTRLKRLLCYDNQLENLDVSKNTVLEELFCNTNQLKSLNVSQNHALKLLYFYGNQVSTLDVSQNLKLEQLYFSRNKITSLDVRKNTALKELECAENEVQKIDVTKNTELEELWAGECGLSNLNLDNNTKLKQLHCSNNPLTGYLKVSKNTALETLYFHDTGVTWIWLKNNVKLKRLYVWNNKLTKLDQLQYCVDLEELKCQTNQIKSLNVSGCSSLNLLWCQENQINSLDLSHNPKLTPYKYNVRRDKNVHIQWH